MNYIAIARENRQKALSTLGMNQRNLFIAPCHPIRARRDGLFRSAASRMSPNAAVVAAT
ncbi:hypothetical protein SAMN04488012_10117 [Palleronia salina]|uniref:Uncharacterized protein n=2 Tax=Palleronia TaxID=315422 RepID=A0A1M6A7B2_9RHOB|nr:MULTISPECIES: hypothetical protein [Palleronia]SEN66095.1 hypothetical protein SAMN04488011_105182 [Palleronia pelagia]SHI32365.1 hypothetical protein SAMN04488012_10117 [Palleronia salina]